MRFARLPTYIYILIVAINQYIHCCTRIVYTLYGFRTIPLQQPGLVTLSDIDTSCGSVCVLFIAKNFCTIGQA